MDPYDCFQNHVFNTYANFTIPPKDKNAASKRKNISKVKIARAKKRKAKK